MSRVQPPADATLPARHPDAPAPGTPLPSHYTHCYGCGAAEPRGLRVRTVAGDGLDLTATVEITEHHQGAPGLAHGGLLTAVLDEAFGALGHLTRMSAVTARLETDFRRPVPVGSTLHLRARVDGVAGRRMYVSGEARLGGPTAPVAVRARALFMQVGVEHFVTHARQEEIDAVIRDPSMIILSDRTVNP